MPILKKQEEGFFLKRKLPSEGTTGWCGPFGVCGPCGPQGICGPIGICGLAGYCGTKGFCGPCGPQGICGTKGFCGPCGPQGICGPIGICGLAGYCGTKGFCGPIGLCGPKGSTGSCGAAGGPCGLTGNCGPQGICGPIGICGLAGYCGTKGFCGPCGPKGHCGPKGSTGSCGAAGGPCGLTGNCGPIGICGLAGYCGARGVIGAESLILNGGFEQDDNILANTPLYWSYDKSTDVAFDSSMWSSTYAYSGKYGVRLTSAYDDIYTRKSDALIPVAIDEKYHLSFYIKSLTLADQVTVYIIQYDSASTEVGTPLAVYQATPPYSWTKIMTSFGAGTSLTFHTATKFIQVNISMTGSANDAAIDDFRLIRRLEGVDIVLGTASDGIYMNAEEGTINLNSSAIVLDGLNSQICIGSGICLSGIGSGYINVGSYMSLDGTGTGTIKGGTLLTTTSISGLTGYIQITGNYIDIHGDGVAGISAIPRLKGLVPATGPAGIYITTNDSGSTETALYLDDNRLVFGSDGNAMYMYQASAARADFINGALRLTYNGGKTTLELSDTTTGVGLTIGGDTNLYRGGANILKTDGAFYMISTGSYGGGIRLYYSTDYWELTPNTNSKLIFGINGSNRVTFDDAGGQGTITLYTGTNVGMTISNDTYIYRTNANDMRIDTNLGVNRTQTTYTLEVEGAIWASGAVYSNQSDKRLKEHIKKLDNAKEIIRKLGGYSFVWNSLNGEKSGKFDYGLIAQEVKAIIPEAVYIDPDRGYYGIITEKLMPFLIEAMKEMQNEIDDLKEKINGN